jgi:hypothetical protein
LKRKLKIKDRRKFARYPATMFLEIKRERSPAPGLEAGVFEGRSVDVSQSGARFTTRELFHRNERLILTFFAPGGDAELSCEVAVIRSTRLSQAYEVAVEITRLIPLDAAVAADAEGTA